MENGKKIKYFELAENLRSMIRNGKIRPQEKLPSENELAAEYQVSRQTVRKALSILQEEGCIYTEHGRGTFCSDWVSRRKNTKNIAVVTTYLSDYIFPTVIQGIDEVLTENGYSILLKNTNNSRKREAKCLEELLQKDIDGLIIEPSKSQIFCKHLDLYALLDECRIPYVFIQGTYAQLNDKPHILMNDRKGGFLITEYLIARGRKNIIGIFKADDLQGQERHNGYAAALQQAGIAYDPDMVVWYHTEDRRMHPYERIRQMAKERRNKPFDAVVCYNDQIAVSVLKALEEENIDCPDEVAVTGYDDSYLAASCRVPLTTIAHPQERLGQTAAGLLLKLIRKEAVTEPECSVLMEPELVVRDSTD